jgi:hypothetical protein
VGARVARTSVGDETLADVPRAQHRLRTDIGLIDFACVAHVAYTPKATNIRLQSATPVARSAVVLNQALLVVAISQDVTLALPIDGHISALGSGIRPGRVQAPGVRGAGIHPGGIRRRRIPLKRHRAARI